MPSVLQVNVGLSPVVVWNGRQSTGINTLLLWNSDTVNTVYIGSESNITSGSPNTIPLPPNGSISVDPASPWWVTGAVAGTAPLVVLPNGQNFFLGLTQGMGKLTIPQIQSPNFNEAAGTGWAILKDGSAYFADVVLPNLPTGTSATFSATEPENPVTGDLWYDTANGLEVSQWNGTEWVPYQIGTQAIAPGAISSALLAAGAAVGNLSPGDITADLLAGAAALDNIGAAGITAAYLAAGAVTTGALAAGSVDAGAIAAGTVVAGIVNGTVVTGATVVADGSNGEVLVYTGAPARGNLLVAISGSNGTDAYGNDWIAGISVLGASGAVLQLLDSTGEEAAILMNPAGEATATVTPQIFSAAEFPGEANEYLQLSVNSGEDNGNDSAALNLFSEAANSATIAEAALVLGDATMLAATRQGVTISSPGGIMTAPVIAYTQALSLSGSGGTFFPLTDDYAIPAGDAQLIGSGGTVYRLKAYGNGTPGATGTWSFAIAIGTTAHLYAACEFASAALTTGSVVYSMEFILSVRATGATGVLEVNGTVTASTTIASTATANNVVACGNTTGVPFDTTVANNVFLAGAMSASGDIGIYASTFERLGP